MTRVILLAMSRTYRAGAFLDAVRRLGLDVTVGSERPQALADRNPVGHLLFDSSDPEVAAAAVVRFGRMHPVHAVVAADDDTVLAAALAARELGLPHHAPEAVRAARDKRIMRSVLAEAGRRGPRYHCFEIDDDPDRVAAMVQLPCVIKPADLGASRGVIRADSRESFRGAFARTAAIAAAAGASGLLVESYVPGVEVALEGYVRDGQLTTFALFDKPDPLEGPFFEETIYVTPSLLIAAEQEAVAAEVSACAAALDLSNGPVHAELRVHAGTTTLIEIAPRSIGGLCSRTLHFTGGHSLESVLLRCALRDPPEQFRREAVAAGVLMIPIPRAGRLGAVRGREAAGQVPGIEEIRITILPGEDLVPLPEGARYLGFVFARAERPEQVEAALRAAHARLEFDIEDSSTSLDRGARSA